MGVPRIAVGGMLGKGLISKSIFTGAILLVGKRILSLPGTVNRAKNESDGALTGSSQCPCRRNMGITAGPSRIYDGCLLRVYSAVNILGYFVVKEKP